MQTVQTLNISQLKKHLHETRTLCVFINHIYILQLTRELPELEHKYLRTRWMEYIVFFVWLSSSLMDPFLQNLLGTHTIFVFISYV